MVDGLDLKTKSGYRKMRFCCKQTITKGPRYFGIDTCCIDKASSAELSKITNSMYSWYRSAEVRFVYLSDVPKAHLRQSRRLTRGWLYKNPSLHIRSNILLRKGLSLGPRIQYARTFLR
jgi:hypothetical protein